MKKTWKKGFLKLSVNISTESDTENLEEQEPEFAVDSSSTEDDFKTPPSDNPNSFALTFAKLAIWIGGFLFFGIMILLSPIASDYALVSNVGVFFISVIISFPIVVFIWLASHKLHGRKGFYYIPVFLMSFSTFAAIIACLIIVNGALDDTAEPELHVAKVIKKYETRGALYQGPVLYVLVVESWREHEYTIKVGVPKALYQKVKPGSSTMTVKTKPGKLGFEWKVEEAKYKY